MAEAQAKRPLGRPKNDDKRTAIIESARRLFVDHAYEHVTMEQVARAAEVAKMTLYSHFADKEALFEAMVHSTSEQMAAALPDLPSGSGDVEERLNAFGRAFLSVLFSRVFVGAMHRQFAMLARNKPLAERIFNAGPGHTRAVLARYLALAFGPDRLAPDRSAEFAADLISLWLGDTQQRLALGLVTEMTPEQIAQHVCRTTDLLLRGYGYTVAGGQDRPQQLDLGRPSLPATL